ncbi:glutathione S-transferase family protein [Enterobacter sp. TMH.L2]|uniref:glutathione S-transferase family protein n=1 Tax=Enterobacteriaceae TaxID=543 RepID=UPI000272B55A|nr:glutathione S-transferase [Enterobacter sp. Ag1]EJF31993.1 glutathione S-transferase [Enterobacter sp. Ag1]
MLTVHHLNNSRSQRVLWMLEELAQPYQIVRYQREPSMLAPEALKKIHPLGKSPVVEDSGHILAESGAILEYLQETYDSENHLKPQDINDKIQYRFWLHYAEGSLMSLLLMKLVFGSLGKAPVPWPLRPVGKALGQGVQKAWLNKQLTTHARFIEDHLSQHPWFAGQQFSAADIQMSFPVAALLARGEVNDMPHTQAWMKNVQTRPAWQRALNQGGPFEIPGA